MSNPEERFHPIDDRDHSPFEPSMFFPQGPGDRDPALQDDPMSDPLVNQGPYNETDETSGLDSDGGDLMGGLGLLGGLLAGLLAALGMGCASGGPHDDPGAVPEGIFVPGDAPACPVPEALTRPVLAVDRLTGSVPARVRDVGHQTLAYRTSLAVCNARLDVIQELLHRDDRGTGLVSPE